MTVGNYVRHLSGPGPATAPDTAARPSGPPLPPAPSRPCGPSGALRSTTVAVGVLHDTKPSDGVSDPRVVQFLPIGGGAAAVCGGVTPTSQTTSVNNAENGLLVAKWSAFWAVPGGMGCSRTLSGAWPGW